MNLKLPGTSHGMGCLGMEDGNFWHLGGVTTWNSQFLKYTWTFLAIICVASQLFLYFFWISLWVKNRCLQHPCFKKKLCKIAQASKNSNSNAQHFHFGFADTFMMFTPCSLHSQVINSLILSWIGVSLYLSHRIVEQSLSQWRKQLKTQKEKYMTIDIWHMVNITTKLERSWQ
jgi:hypothetical protein